MNRKISPIEERVTQLMQEKGISTKRELSSRAGYSEQHLSMALKGKYKPSARKIATLGRALGLTAVETCTLLHIDDEVRMQQAQKVYEQTAPELETKRYFNQLYTILCREIARQYYQKPLEEQQAMIFSLGKIFERYGTGNSEYTPLALDLVNILRESRFPVELNLPARVTTEIGSALALLQQRIPEDDFNQILDKTYEGFVAALNTAFQAGESAEKIVFLDKLEKILMQYTKKS